MSVIFFCLHYSCIQVERGSRLCILLCSAASSQCSSRCDSGEEEENIQDGHILVCRADGGFDSYSVTRHRITAFGGRGGVTNSSPHGVRDGFFSSWVLLRGLGRRALGLGVLGGGGLAAPGAVVAQSRGAVEVVLVVQAVGGVVLRVLQASDETLVLVPELAAHQGRLAHHHHVLERERDRK